jgi:hypothetical protein
MRILSKQALFRAFQKPYKNTPSPPSKACLIHSQNCAYKVGLEYLPKHRAITLHNTLAIRHSKSKFLFVWTEAFDLLEKLIGD